MNFNKFTPTAIFSLEISSACFVVLVNFNRIPYFFHRCELLCYKSSWLNCDLEEPAPKFFFSFPKKYHNFKQIIQTVVPSILLILDKFFSICDFVLFIDQKMVWSISGSIVLLEKTHFIEIDPNSSLYLELT